MSQKPPKPRTSCRRMALKGIMALLGMMLTSGTSFKKEGSGKPSRSKSSKKSDFGLIQVPTGCHWENF